MNTKQQQKSFSSAVFFGRSHRSLTKLNNWRTDVIYRIDEKKWDEMKRKLIARDDFYTILLSPINNRWDQTSYRL